MTLHFSTLAAILYAAVTTFAVGFQIALAAGAPWGSYAMGGRFPGRLPLSMRVAALVQGLLLTGLAAVVLSRAGVALGWLSRGAPWLIWVVVVISALSLALNSMTPSAGERRVWAPVALAMLASSLVVALRS